MVYQSLKKLLSKYPWFFDKSETSNFFRSQFVTNRQFQDLYQSLFTVIQSFKLNKRCLIWKDQTAPYDYIINFVANFPNMKSVSCYKNDALIYSEHYTYEENVSSFIYFYDSSDETISMEDVFEETDEEPTDDEPEEEIPIIPADTFKIIVETYDEYQIIKGFPENDTRQGNEFDHDYSLDRIGQIDGIPRKEYIETVDYANTEPPYNNRLTEDDYHYMNRILNYNLLFHNTPRPVLEIWKMYGIFSDMINREQYLFKMFDENHHLNKETGLYDPNWTPQQWEHKDRLCELTPNLGQFFFVSANTLLPVKNQSIRFDFKFLNSLAETLTGDYNITIFLNEEEYITQYTNTSITIPSDALLDDEPNLFQFIAFEGDQQFSSEELIVNVRGCNSADWYVSPNGDDANDGKTNQTAFKTIAKALNSVNGEENLIVLTSGTHTINQIVSIPYSCTLLGCGSPIVNSTKGLKFFNVLQNQTLNIQDLTLQHDTSSTLVSNAIYQNNNKTRNGFYVVISEGVGKIISIIELDTDKETYTIGDTITITGTLLDNENTGLSNKQVKIYVNNVLVDTVTTLNTGGFSKTVTAETSGNMTIRAVFDGDEEYYSSTEGVTVHVNKKPVTITFTSNKVSYVLGETITLSGTLKQGITNIGSASIEIYDGETLLDTVTTLSDGTFSKTITAGTVESKSFHAVYNGDATYESATSSNVNVTITKRTPTISLLTSKSSVSTGDSYTLSGALLYNGTGVANASVKLYQGQSVIDTLTTANDGTFSKTITSTAEGTFTYHVVFDATTTYTGVTSGNVTVTVSDVSFDAIELTSDKDILSAYDEESATLTAQLMSGTTPVAIAGETVTFEVRKTGDDSLVETLTADTNSSGVATVSYLGKSVGDLNIKAIVDSIIPSEIFVLEDCFNALLTEQSISNSSGTKISSVGLDTIYNIRNVNFSLEFKHTGNGVLNIGRKSSWSSSSANYRATIGYADGKHYYATRTTSSNESYGDTASTTTEYQYKLTRNGSTISYYVDDVLIGTKSFSTFASYDDWSIYSIIWGNGTSTISNIKLKPL